MLTVPLQSIFASSLNRPEANRPQVYRPLKKYERTTKEIAAVGLKSSLAMTEETTKEIIAVGLKSSLAMTEETKFSALAFSKRGNDRNAPIDAKNADGRKTHCITTTTARVVTFSRRAVRRHGILRRAVRREIRRRAAT